MPRIKGAVQDVPNQECLYPTIRVSICVGEKALTADRAKELLDWQSETKNIKFGDDYLFTDDNKCKVRCLNNTRNRPFNEEWSRSLAQDILNKRWRVNLETIIIGKDAQVLSGQHRLIGLILAVQIWELDEPDGQWKSKWDTEPTMETLVAFGADESEECTRTLDNVRPRTLSDVLFTSAMFGDHRPKDRKVIVRVVDYAVRILWQRTGVSAYRTHSEALDFIGRHPRLLEAVKHVCEEDKDGDIRRFISPGYAAGLLYMMAATTDSRDSYLDGDTGSEERLELSQWDDACEFWSTFARQGGMNPLKLRLQPRTEGEDDDEAILLSAPEQVSLVVKAWQAVLDHQPVNDKTLKLRYAEKNGFRVLDEMPVMGGIDVGYKMASEKEEEEQEGDYVGEVTRPSFHPRGPKGTPEGQAPQSDVRAKQASRQP